MGPVSAMSVEEVIHMFGVLHLEKYADRLLEDDIDGLVLLDLVKHDGLDELGMTKLHAARLRKHLGVSRIDVAATAEGPEAIQAAQAAETRARQEANGRGAIEALEERRPAEEKAVQDERDGAAMEADMRRAAEERAAQEARDRAEEEATMRRAAEERAARAARDRAGMETTARRAAEERAAQDSRDRADAEVRVRAAGPAAGRAPGYDDGWWPPAAPSGRGRGGDRRDEGGDTTLARDLCGSCRAGDNAAVLSLLRAQPNPNCLDQRGRLPLAEAVLSGDHGIVALLLVARASPSAPTGGGAVALGFAGGDEVMRTLLTEPMESMRLDSPWENNWKDAEWQTARRALQWAKMEHHKATRSFELATACRKMVPMLTYRDELLQLTGPGAAARRTP